jgi:hypothetical protein
VPNFFRVVVQFSLAIKLCANLRTLGLAKRDLWGLGAGSWFIVASYAFAKMIFIVLNI